MRAIHLKCEHENGRPHGLDVADRATHRYRSCCWDITPEDAALLVGGWLYLHETKKERSYFGGRVLSFDHIRRDDLAHPNRIAFLVEAKAEARGLRWRGASHVMAHCGGVVEADLPHER